MSSIQIRIGDERIRLDEEELAAIDGAAPHLGFNQTGHYKDEGRKAVAKTTAPHLSPAEGLRHFITVCAAIKPYLPATLPTVLELPIDVSHEIVLASRVLGSNPGDVELPFPITIIESAVLPGRWLICARLQDGAATFTNLSAVESALQAAGRMFDPMSGFDMEAFKLMEFPTGAELDKLTDGFK
ncbi:hypothetical protein GCM10025771_27650 [Niveibacterium umoris]|uniref:Uncharacterized protein n=1 Tax=Niveibacterium umoris TaxID=1193620 RepID=A0A840BKA1_9RHOO|nr:hypothetical protein [Niveibacterium umoris]MBB4012042.1 hypothetical protein [Niveibacterium umoris]